jgi:hypothetical protein
MTRVWCARAIVLAHSLESKFLLFQEVQEDAAPAMPRQRRPSSASAERSPKSGVVCQKAALLSGPFSLCPAPQRPLGTFLNKSHPGFGPISGLVARSEAVFGIGGFEPRIWTNFYTAVQGHQLHANDGRPTGPTTEHAARGPYPS